MHQMTCDWYCRDSSLLETHNKDNKKENGVVISVASRKKENLPAMFSVALMFKL